MSTGLTVGRTHLQLCQEHDGFLGHLRSLVNELQRHAVWGVHRQRSGVLLFSGREQLHRVRLQALRPFQQGMQCTAALADRIIEHTIPWIKIRVELLQSCQQGRVLLGPRLPPTSHMLMLLHLHLSAPLFTPAFLLVGFC